MNVFRDTDKIVLPQNIMKIFSSFCTLKIKCGAKRFPSLTKKREKQISDAIQLYGTSEILLVLDFFINSSDSYADFMRNNGYTELDNIFNEYKWFDKINRANDYKSCYINKYRKAI